MRQAAVSPLLSGGWEAQRGTFTPPKVHSLQGTKRKFHPKSAASERVFTCSVMEPKLYYGTWPHSVPYWYVCWVYKIEIVCLLIRGFCLCFGRNVLDQGTSTAFFENWKIGKK